MENRYLFKAKRIDNREWVEGLLTKMWGQFHIINPDDENTAYPINENTICQCTGLKDKNGKLIWENDILCAHLDDLFPDDVTYVRVIWRENGFYLQQYLGAIELIDDLEYTDLFEVCGNAIDWSDVE